MDHWDAALDVANSQWTGAVRSQTLLSSTQARYLQVLESFCRYALAMGVASPEEVTEALCLRFMEAPLRGGHRISRATARIRLTVLRSAFDAWVAEGALPANPVATLRVEQEARTYEPRPLTPPEVTRLLATGRTEPRDTLRPATVAVALTGASHDEIAHAVVADLDVPNHLIRLGARDHARGCAVPSSGALEALEARVGDQRRIWRRRSEPWDPTHVPLALSRAATSYPVNSVAPTVSGNLALALRQAGIRRAGLRPKSIREYAANACYAEVGRIEAVAELLGLRSLDTAARLIDQEWQSRWGRVIRQTAET